MLRNGFKKPTAKYVGWDYGMPWMVGGVIKKLTFQAK